MFMINRSVIMVKPKAPYIEWANGLEEDGPKLSLSDSPRERTIYLVDEIEFTRDFDKVIDKHFSKIFEHELYLWHIAEEDWPQDRGRDVFNKWFEFESHSLVLDLCDYAFEVEEIAG